jgi:hypothetical protein
MKRVKDKPDLAAEFAKPKINADLRSGRGCVFVWNRETPDRQELETWLSGGVKNAGLVASATLILVEDIERLARVHPALVQAFGGPPIVALPLSAWAATLDADIFPYQSDDLRRKQLEAIQQFAEDNSKQVVHFRVVGETGVGKSRLTYEALRKDGLRERVAAAFSPTDVEESSLRALVTSPDSHLVLVVDDCGDSDAERLEHYASASGGRLRLITVGDRPERRPEPDPRALEIRPLADGLVSELVRQVTNLRQEDAEQIAFLAQGFPKLAVELANLVTHSAAPDSVLELLRSARIDAILDAMLPQTDIRRHLGHLAFVERLGFDGELEVEASAFCEHFKLDSTQFRAAVDQETGRFVTAFGRYRKVTPKALAVWLLYETVSQDTSGYGERLATLPASLFAAFREQIELLGGDPLIDRLVEEVLAKRADSFRVVSELTNDGARLLNAASFAVPETAAGLIYRLLNNSSEAELKSLSGDRRWQLVWALQHLLWFRTTFNQAADSLLALAVTENEPYSNNATGTLVGAFQLLLGGTELPFSQRLSWLEASRERYGDKSGKIAFNAALAALSIFQGRTGGWRGSRRQPVEWRPTPNELTESLRDAWRLLNQLVDQYPALQLEFAKAIDNLFVVPRPAPTIQELVDQIGAREWMTKPRAELTAGLRTALEHGQLDAKQKSQLRELITKLEGSSLEQRARVVIATPYWQLGESAEDMQRGPRVVDLLAQELLSDGDLARVIVGARDDVDELTIFNLFRAVALLDESRRLESIVTDPDANRFGRLGYLSGRGEAEHDWADRILQRWFEDSRLAHDVPIGVSRLPSTTSRLNLALEAVLSGRAPAPELAHLTLGMWVRSLEEDDLIRLLTVYLEFLNQLQPRFAFWTIDAWLHERHKPSERLREIASTLVLETSTSDDASLIYLIDQLGDKIGLPFETRWSAFLNRMLTSHYPWPTELVTFRKLAREDSATVASDLVDLLQKDDRGWSLSLQSSSLLSAVVDEGGVMVLEDSVKRLTEKSQIRLLNHFDFKRDDLDPVVVTLLEDHRDSEEFQNAISRAFAYPNQVVSGSYASYLERRKATLDRWAESHQSQVVRDWAAKLSQEFTPWIQRERRVEVEGF